MLGFIWFLFIVVCFLLMLVVLLQRGDAGGVGAAFGGGGGETAFGVKADTTWKQTTAVLATLFFVLAITLSWLMSAERGASLADEGQDPAGSEAPAEPGAGEAAPDAGEAAPDTTGSPEAGDGE